MQLLPSSFCLISAQTHPFDLCPHYFTILLLSGARYHIPDIIFHEIFTKNVYIWWYNISDIRVRGQKPRCACTGVVSWLPDPPKYEHKSEASASRYANIWQDCESAKHGTIRMISRNSHYEHKSEASASRYANVGNVLHLWCRIQLQLIAVGDSHSWSSSKGLWEHEVRNNPYDIT